MPRTPPVVWINGSFGVGKTTVARALCDAWPALLLYDPEVLGFVLRRLPVPSWRRGDFQDLRIWRRGTVWCIRLLLLGRRRPLVVPMTIIEHADEVLGGLRAAGVDVRHVTLTASAATLHERLLGRGVPLGDWAHAQVDRCVAGLAGAGFDVHVDTDGREVADVVDDVLAAVDAPRGGAGP